MGPALYIMAILGCGEADSACQQFALAPAQYESLDACNAATEAQIMDQTDSPYPVVVAQCRRADAPASQILMPADIDMPEAAPEQRIDRKLAKPVQIASRG